MIAEEGQNFVVDTAISAVPVGIAARCAVSSRAVELFRFVRNAELIELVGKGLVSEDMVPYAVAAGPVKF